MLTVSAYAYHVEQLPARTQADLSAYCYIGPGKYPQQHYPTQLRINREHEVVLRS